MVLFKAMWKGCRQFRENSTFLEGSRPKHHVMEPKSVYSRDGVGWQAKDLRRKGSCVSHQGINIY
jgi:hypothetical protein